MSFGWEYQHFINVICTSYVWLGRRECVACNLERCDMDERRCRNDIQIWWLFHDNSQHVLHLTISIIICLFSLGFSFITNKQMLMTIWDDAFLICPPPQHSVSRYVRYNMNTHNHTTHNVHYSICIWKCAFVCALVDDLTALLHTCVKALTYIV